MTAPSSEHVRSEAWGSGVEAQETTGGHTSTILGLDALTIVREGYDIKGHE